ncbi:MAG: DUF6159 family protein [Solirubrobacterales bacterium]
MAGVPRSGRRRGAASEHVGEGHRDRTRPPVTLRVPGCFARQDLATIGLALSALENQGCRRPILGRVLAVGWSLITFLAVPMIALEGSEPFAALKRSAGLFKSRWGAQVTGNIAIGGAVFLVGVLPSALLIFAGFLIWASTSFVGALLLVLGVIGLAISMLVSSALSNIFGVALYRYALDGEAVGGFTAHELESAVKPRGGRNAPTHRHPGHHLTPRGENSAPVRLCTCGEQKAHRKH